MKRRNFIKLALEASLTAMLPSAALSADVGVSASPGLLDAIQSLTYITEGSGSGNIYVVYTPWCHLSPEFYEITRPHLSNVKFSWVPHSGGQPEGKIGTEILLESLSPKDISNSFVPIQSYKDPGSTPLADAQDAKMVPFSSIFISDVGRGLVTPTLIFDRGGNRIRVIRGAPDKEYLDKIVRYVA